MGKIFWNRKNGYGIFLDEYNGNFKLVSGQQADEDKLDWGWRQIWQNKRWEPAEKAVPINVYFGGREKAVEALEFFLEATQNEPSFIENIFWNRKSGDSEAGYGIFLDEYNHEYRLIAGKKGDQADYYEWGWPQEEGQKESYSKRPIHVRLGEHEQAIEALEFFLKALGQEPKEIPEDDIPF